MWRLNVITCADASPASWETSTEDRAGVHLRLQETHDAVDRVVADANRLLLLCEIGEEPTRVIRLVEPPQHACEQNIRTERQIAPIGELRGGHLLPGFHHA